jgi:hypothetical protein
MKNGIVKKPIEKQVERENKLVGSSCRRLKKKDRISLSHRSARSTHRLQDRAFLVFKPKTRRLLHASRLPQR